MLLVLGLVPARAAAQAVDTFGFGSRNVALAGAVTADVEDFAANYYNPAGLVRGDELRLGVGYFGAHFDMSIDGADSNLDPLRGSVFGLVVPGVFGGVPVSFGLGGHLNDARISRSRALPRQRPRWEMYDNRPHRTFLGAHVAVEPWDWLRVGAGIAFLSTSKTTLDLRGNLGAVNAEATSRIEHQIGGDLQTIRYPQAGVQVDAGEHLSFGLVYRHEFALSTELEGEAIAAITGVGDPIPAYLYLLTASVNAFVPRQLSLGASLRPDDRWRIGAEITWVNWAAYRSSIGSTDAILDIDVPPELAGIIRVPDAIEPTRPIPPHFRDRFVPRIGVEHRLVASDAWDLDLRAGYLYEATPIPDQSGFTNLLDNDRHAFSVGAGVRLTDLEPLLPGFLAIDVHAQWGIVPERETQKDSLVDRVGDYRYEGQVFAAGATVEVGLE